MIETDIATGPPESRFVHLARESTAILIGAVVAGFLAGGLGSRLMMLGARLLAPERRGFFTEAGNRVGEVTFEGSLFLIIFIGLFTSLAVGITLAVVGVWVPLERPWSGVLVGAILLALFSPTILDPGNFDFDLLGDQAITVAVIVAMFLAAGVLATVVRDRLKARMPEPTTLRDGAVFVPAAVLGAVAILLLFAGLGAPAEDGTTDLDLVVVLFALLVVVTIVDRILWIVRGKRRAKMISLMGWALFGATAIAGLVRLVSDIAAIVA